MLVSDAHLHVSLCLVDVSCLLGTVTETGLLETNIGSRILKKEERNSWIEVKILFGGSIKALNKSHIPVTRETCQENLGTNLLKCNVKALMWPAKPKQWTWDSEIIEICLLRCLKDSKEGKWPQGWDGGRTQHSGRN